MASKYQHLPDDTYEMKAEHVEDVAELLVSSFSRKNVVWSKANLELLKFKQFFVDTLNNHLELQKRAQKALGKQLYYSTFSIQDGFMTSCALHYDIEEYRLMIAENRTPMIPFFNILEELGTKLMKEIDVKSFQTGKAVYFTFGGRSTNKKAPKIPGVLCLGEHYVHLKQQGYRYVIGRISNELLKQHYQNLGSVMVSKITFEVGKGKEQNTLYLTVLDMQNPTFLKVQQEIKEFREQQRQTQAKL